MNRKGGFSDIFLFMIVSVIIVVISAVFIYIGGRVNTELHASMDGETYGDRNATEIINETMGKVSNSYNALYWIAIFLIVGMIVSIFIGSYMVTTRPIFFLPYTFITIIAIIIAVGLSNAYMDVAENPTLTSTFENFVGANYILAYLPIWVAIIGVVGAIIMFARMGSREEQIYGGYYG